MVISRSIGDASCGPISLVWLVSIRSNKNSDVSNNKDEHWKSVKKTRALMDALSGFQSRVLILVILIACLVLIAHLLFLTMLAEADLELIVINLKNWDKCF